jgi:class 3 adenylate cyclase
VAGYIRCGAEILRDARFWSKVRSAGRGRTPLEERKLATVLFADLVGSTELAGSQDPERTRVFLDRFYDAMVEEIEHAGAGRSRNSPASLAELCAADDLLHARPI